LGSFVAKRQREYGPEQAASLDKALEKLMVEAYQLSVDAETLNTQFIKKLIAWKGRLLEGARENERGH
jgi:hypothetical protein